MFGGWTEIAVLKKNLIGFIWDIWNVFKIYIIIEFERKVDVQNHQFEWVRFKNRSF